MNSFLNWMFIFLLIVYSISMGSGINLKKWYGWVQVLSGFVLGLLMGSVQNIIASLVLGIFFAVLMILFGPIMWKYRHP